MHIVWGLRVVNMKPGFLRFYCWTKDFKPQAQMQTHAQIWVRLMHLPQEYWRKTTLFEIASGLGTPLAIDEITQSRHFGIFARVLVDVDLSEQLFETVVVEREDHALSIDVFYEKQPSFCANCKTLGHSLQNCMKLNHTNNTEVPARMKTRTDLNGKKHAAGTSIAFKTVSGKKQGGLDVHSKKNSASGTLNVEEIATDSVHHEIPQSEIVPADSINISKSTVSWMELENLPFSTQKNLEKEGAEDDENVTVILKDMSSGAAITLQDANSYPALALHNSFDILHEDSELPFGETSLVDQGLSNSSYDMQHAILEPVGVAKNVSATVTNSLDASLIIAPNVALNPVLSDKNNIVVQHPMPQPITTYYTSLTSDKLPVSTVIRKHTTNIHSEASLKSVQILKKLWGDIDDDDDEEDSASDDSLKEAEFDVSKYLAHNVELPTNKKAQRQKKGKSSAGKIFDNDNTVLVSKQQRKHITQANHADLADSEGIITRSKRGISKPKILEP